MNYFVGGSIRILFQYLPIEHIETINGKITNMQINKSKSKPK